MVICFDPSRARGHPGRRRSWRGRLRKHARWALPTAGDGLRGREQLQWAEEEGEWDSGAESASLFLQTSYMVGRARRTGKEASRGFEPRLLDSGSRVLAVTPRGQGVTQSQEDTKALQWMAVLGAKGPSTAFVGFGRPQGPEHPFVARKSKKGRRLRSCDTEARQWDARGSSRHWDAPRAAGAGKPSPL